MVQDFVRSPLWPTIRIAFTQKIGVFTVFVDFAAFF